MAAATARSNLACDVCKKKKARCDRQIPTCSFCQRTANCCTYPSTRLKPGPKLGSTQRPRRLRSHPVKVRDVTEHISNTSQTGSLEGTSCHSCQTCIGDSDGTPSLSPMLPQATSSRNTKNSDVPALNFANAISLFNFLYPSHDSSLDSSLGQKDRSQPGFLLVFAGAQENLTKACEVLRMSIQQTQSMIDLFFDMVVGLRSLSIFHQPSFPDKIRGIQDHNHLIALFAAMFSLSSRMATVEKSSQDDQTSMLSHQELHALSLEYIHTSLDACSSTAPPLCLLQAITLAGYYKLVNGVYGSAWRLVGMGVRIAYELRLHLIDCKGSEKAPTCDSELVTWTFDEERRRCWWALWEMDIFASTIKRAPTAIDWSANKTYLPVSDEYWFAKTFQASCLLDGSPDERWKRLKRSGNENSVAWANLLASFMHDGRILCQETIKGIFSDANPQKEVPKLAHFYSQDYRRKSQEFADRLSSLVRAYEDLTDNLPTIVSYHGEPLSFSLEEGEDIFYRRRISAGKYSVHMMSASACFMIHQNYVFADIIEGLIPLPFSETDDESSTRKATMNESLTSGKTLRNYLETSNMVLRLLANCPEDHVRHVNPYYASTVWIAAALQVFKKIASRDDVSMVSQRQYALLRRTYLQFSHFWETPCALLQNLDSLEARLATRQRELETLSCRNQNAHTNNNLPFGETACSMSIETMMSSACQDQPFGDWTGLKNSQLDTREPTLTDPDMSNSTLLEQDTLGWLPAFDSSMSQTAFLEQCNSTWPDNIFMGNLAWYSSDVMAGLSHGYTA